MKLRTILTLLLIYSLSLNSQISHLDNGEYTKVIKIENGSFEKVYHDKHKILKAKHWEYCAYEGHPLSMIQFNESLLPDAEVDAYDGNKHFNMVVRADTTWEAISYKLDRKLIKDQAYYISLHSCISTQLECRVKIDRRECCMENKKFNTPVVIRILGGNKHCDYEEVLSVSDVIRNKNWKEYIFEFIPTADYKYLTIEAHYDPRASRTYYGNVSIDAVSDIYIKKEKI